MQPSTSTQPVRTAKTMEATNMVEVDPKLFVTCRLCLEDMGVYQIVPAIQQQIKYCFDIDVDPFDGLPQLLCKKCESLLCDYFKTKKSFTEKQKSLKKMKQDLKMVPLAYPQQDTVSSSQQTNGDNNLNIYHKQTKKTKRKRVISTTTDSDSSTNTAITKAQTPPVTEFNSTKCTSWESDYNKLFVCKLCNGYFRRKNAVINHLRAHRVLMSKYRNILKTYCTVELTRLDYKPNITGDINKVVHSFQKITQEGNSYYYVIYVLKDECAVMNSSVSFSSYKPVRTHITSDSSSIDERQRDNRQSSTLYSGDESNMELKRRKSRLLSASSNETVVIGNKKNKTDLENNGDDLKIKTFFGDNKEAHNYIDCIDIEDSSDNSSNKSNSVNKQDKVSRKPIKVKPQECKAIHNIISLCHKKYMKRKEASESDTQNKKPNKDYLKHKVLSIGRKIVTKRGFNCNGLLRYMESKNLEIVWIPRSQQNASKETSYIQINAKLRNNKENGNDFNKSEWKTVTQTPHDDEQEDAEAVEHPSSLSVDNTRQTDITLPRSVVTIQCKVKEPIQTDCAVLYPEPSNTESKSILLNENPVANPKHFPKKTNLTTSKHNVSNIIYDETPNVADVIENNDSSLCLPIITSTQSLAVIESTDKMKQSVDKNTTSNTQPSSENTNIDLQVPGPRIKVKPVTELLSERILHSIMNAQTNHPTQSSSSQTQNISQPLQVIETSSSLNTSIRIAPEPSTVQREYVILDTVEFPNTKTDSPFRYFKHLLQIHNIVLLDTDHFLPRDFTCLIKFKVLYKQETKDHPVILCLSLFCLENMFCLKVKDRHQENINMNKISANWQWELLKIYKGDVVNKLLQNALKVSQVMHEYTKTFLCLLESINYKTDNQKKVM